ncbi:MAG TPA: sulfotransferase family 2 domain-containing protein [Allosphingosinicella sp.]|nr:sulfotransferase family 2 domain-containing protein [Allosphingosinicella sp.]
MIISHRHRFVFAAVPKTGTHSVRQALRAQLGPEDQEQVGLFVRKTLPYPELARLRHGHIGLEQIRPHLGDAFIRYFKFAFVRNPYDRFVSYCAFMAREGDAFETDPQKVMRHYLFEAPPGDQLLFRPQHSFVTGPDGTLLADQLGRVETMQRSYDEICARIGIETAPLGQANATRHGDYRGYYDERTRAGVAELYARDLELFGYAF